MARANRTVLFALALALWRCSSGIDGPAPKPDAGREAGPTDASAEPPDAGVDAAVPEPPDGPFAPAPPGAEDFLFDETVVRDYRLEIRPEDLEWLDAHALEEQYVPGVLVYEGERSPTVGIRYKGSAGSLVRCFDPAGQRICGKLSFLISFHELTEGGRFFGLKKLQLHSMSQDPTLLREALAYGLYRSVGLVAPRVAYARVYVNGVLQGLYLMVERVDGRFAERWFADGDDGTLFKEVWPRYADPAVYQAALVTHEETGDVSAMVRFAQELGESDDETFPEVLRRWTEPTLLHRHMAMDTALYNWDGVRNFYCSGDACVNHNYFWYQSTADVMALIPWDMDHTFAWPGFWEATPVPQWPEPAPVCEPIDIGDAAAIMLPATCDPLLRGLARSEWDGYVEAARSLLDGPFAEEPVTAAIDRYRDLLDELVAEDPNGPGVEAWETALTDLRQIIPALRDRLAAQIDAPPP